MPICIMGINEHIVSSEEVCVFLHRCTPNNIDKIMRTGVVCGSDPLLTMTWQPKELDNATIRYRAWEDRGNCAVVIKIPRDLWEDAHLGPSREAALDERVGYFHEGKQDFAVRPEFVNGWLDRNTEEYHPNPYRD